MRTHLAVVSAAVIGLTALTGCGAGEADPGAARSDESEAASASPSAPSRTLADRTARSLAHAPGGAFEIRTSAQGTDVARTDGQWVRDPAASRLTLSAKNPETGQDQAVRFVTAGDAVFVQSPGWRAGVRKCWVAMSTEQIGTETGVAVSVTGLPSAVAVGASLRGDSATAGHVDLRDAIGLLPGRTKAGIDLADAKGTVSAAWSVSGKALRMTIKGSDLARAMRSRDLISDEQVGTLLEQITYELTVTPSASPERIAAPAEELRISGDEFETATC